MSIECDVDGVLADFNRGMLEIHSLPLDHVPTHWNWYEDFGMTEEEFWKPAKRLGRGFYVPVVQPYPWFDEVLKLITEADPDVVFVTANPNDPGLYASKLDWIHKYIGHDANVIYCKEKWRLAKPDCLLVDDNDNNVTSFRVSGGSAVLFAQPWNLLRYVSENRIDFLKSNLDAWVQLQQTRKEQCCGVR